MKNKDQPAFPDYMAENHLNGEGLAYLYPQGGLTKREYFAAMAMQGLLADAANDGSPENSALYAVKHADALLAKLEKGGAG